MIFRGHMNSNKVRILIKKPLFLFYIIEEFARYVGEKKR